MPAVGVTDGPPPCARDHQAVVLSCSHLARRWAALERRSAWLVIDAQVKACSRETHSPSRASKTYGHNAFQIIHAIPEHLRGVFTTRHYTNPRLPYLYPYTYTPLLSTVVAHTLLNTAHTVGSYCGYNPG